MTSNPRFIQSWYEIHLTIKLIFSCYLRDIWYNTCMKTTLRTQTLGDILDLASRFVSKSTTLPILENIYIKWWLDSLMFRASDMEKYIEIEIPAEIDQEWALTVTARKFADYVKTIDESEVKLNLDETKKTLNIKTQTDSFRLNGIWAWEYLWLPNLVAKYEMHIDIRQFITGISKVEFAIKEKNFSPVLTWILIKHKIIDGIWYLIFVGTDSLRLAEYRIPSGLTSPEHSVIIPKSNLWEIKQTLEYMISLWAQSAQLTIADNLIWCSTSIDMIKISVVSLLIQWAFPDYDNDSIMPKVFGTTAIVDKASAEKAIKKINILTRDINSYIIVRVSSNSVIVESWETDSGEASSTLQAVTTWPELSIWLNGRSVSDIIRMLSSSTCIFNIVSEEKPVMFTDSDDPAYRYVIRPILK